MLRYKNYFGHIFMEEFKAISNTIKIRKIMQNTNNYHTSVGSKCSKNISNYTYYYEHYQNRKNMPYYNYMVCLCKKNQGSKIQLFFSKGK